MAKVQQAVKFSQTVTELKQQIKRYFSSYKNALAYVVEVEENIVQLCIVFQPFDVSEQHTELYNEPKMNVRVYIERLGVDEVFDCLMQFASKGVITLGGSQKRFAYSPEELSIGSIQLLERERLRVVGREWSSWGMTAHCSQTIDKICPKFNFSKFCSILREERGESSFQELIFNLTRLPYLKIDSGISPGIAVLTPIYARINRCGLVEYKIKFYVETVKGLINNPYLYVNILKFGLGGQPSSLKLSLNKMKFSSSDKQGLHFLSYEMPAEGLGVVELDLKDHAGFSRSSCKRVITWIKTLQKKASHFPRRAILIYSGKAKNLTFPLTLLISTILSVYGAYFYIREQTLPDPLVAVTVAMAIATVLMAYVSKKGIDISRSEKLKPLAEEASNDFLNTLKQEVESIIRGAENDEAVSIVPERLEPKPHLLSVTYDEAPCLLRKLSKLLKAMFSYNTSVNPQDFKKLKATAEEVLKSINDLEAKLSRKYWAKPSSEGTFSF